MLAFVRRRARYIPRKSSPLEPAMTRRVGHPATYWPFLSRMWLVVFRPRIRAILSALITSLQIPAHLGVAGVSLHSKDHVFGVHRAKDNIFVG